MLIAGDRTYHPSLHHRASEWKQEGKVLELIGGASPIGIFAMPRDVAIDFSKHGSLKIASLDQLRAWLTFNHSVEYELVQADKWQQDPQPARCSAG